MGAAIRSISSNYTFLKKTMKNWNCVPVIKLSPSNFHRVKSVQIRIFFWFVFFRIRTEYGEIRSISPYSGRMQENTDQKKLRIWILFTQWWAVADGKAYFSGLPWTELVLFNDLHLSTVQFRSVSIRGIDTEN